MLGRATPQLCIWHLQALQRATTCSSDLSDGPVTYLPRKDGRQQSAWVPNPAPPTINVRFAEQLVSRAYAAIGRCRALHNGHWFTAALRAHREMSIHRYQRGCSLARRCRHRATSLDEFPMPRHASTHQYDSCTHSSE